jgi:predicted RNA methylase
MSRFSYLFSTEEHVLSYPSDEYLDFITPADIFNIVIVNATVQFNCLSDKIVWDMFAGIGTDSLRLSKCSGMVIATEINTDTFNCLKQNTEHTDNIYIYNQDCFTANIQTPDVIYFDPPWGSTFKTGHPFCFDDVRLDNSQTVPELFLNIRARYPEAMFIIKLPFMCDFEKYINEADIRCILTFSRQKIKYIFI